MPSNIEVHKAEDPDVVFAKERIKNLKNYKIVGYNGKIRCPDCDFECVSLKEFQKHIGIHWEDTTTIEFQKYVNLIGRKVAKERKSKKFKIYSLRGSKFYDEFRCDVCKLFCNLGWYYKETSIGEANICPKCKDMYKPSRYPYKLVIKTPFESSKKKF